nr:ASCH domain-containing protein [uncultured Pantoea sp.]
MTDLATLQAKYPRALSWAFGDSPALADTLAALIVQGKKTATCGSLAAFEQDADAPAPGRYCIVLDGQNQPTCVIRIVGLTLMRFCDVTSDFARKEGEGDLSLAYWRQEHQRFFESTGTFDERMELVAEEFALIEVLPR